MSELLGKLAEALAKAQGEIRHAKEDAKNPHFNSTYASLAAVWDACREPLTKNGLAVAQIPEADGPKVTVTTMLLHTSGESIKGALCVTARDPSPQAIGSAITYARRYGLAAMVGISPSDDDDGNAAQPARQNMPSEAPDLVPPPPEAPAENFRIQDDAHKDRLIRRLEGMNVPFRFWDDVGQALDGKPMTQANLDKAIKKVTV